MHTSILLLASVYKFYILIVNCHLNFQKFTSIFVRAVFICRKNVNDNYYDPDVDKLYQYVKIGDFPPEWVVTNIDEDDDYYYASMGY